MSATLTTKAGAYHGTKQIANRYPSVLSYLICAVRPYHHRYKSILLKILSVGISTADIVLEMSRVSRTNGQNSLIGQNVKCHVHYRTHFSTTKITYDKVRGL